MLKPGLMMKLAWTGQSISDAEADGAWRADTRGSASMNTFKAQGLGVYAQDTVELVPHIKWVAGLRFDHFQGDYRDPSGNRFAMSENLWSPRTGLIFQPSRARSLPVMAIGTPPLSGISTGRTPAMVGPGTYSYACARTAAAAAWISLPG